MTTYTRPVKTVSGDGGTSFVVGKTLPAAELDSEFDNLANHVNNNLDETNLRGATQIPNSMLVDIDGTIVSDHADDDSTYLTTTSPGDTGTVSKPTNLEEEMERLRYRHKANNGYFTNLKMMNSAGAAVTAGWTEPPIVGRNLLPNAGFEVYSGTTPAAPDGWTLVGTPLAFVLEAGGDYPLSGIDKRSLDIVTDDTGEGISYTVTGLKQSTKYLVGIAYSRQSGELNLITAGGLGSGDYQDLALTDNSSSGYSVLQGIVKSDSTPSDITVSFTGTAAAANWNFHYVWFYEMSDSAPIEAPHLPMQTATYNTSNDSHADSGTGTWHDLTDLSLSQYIPYEGYRIVYEVTICWRSDGNDAGAATHSWFASRIELDTGGGDATVEGPYAMTGATVDLSSRTGGAFTMKHIVENPTPGLTYAFKTGVYIDDDSNSASEALLLNPTMNGTLATQSQAKLYAERI